MAVTFVTTFVPGAAGTSGVAFNAGTGEVTVTSPLSPQPRLLDFILVARVVDSVQTFNAYIRFHIHAGVTRMWLTPSQLTVRQGARNARYSVLAEFTDGTYGDVSNWSPWREPGPQDRTFVRLPGVPSQPLVTWGSSAVGAMDVHPRTGNLTCRSAGAAAQIQAITALPNGVATGQAAGGPPWSTPLTVVPAPGPGFLDPDKAPNVLILSDGFQVGEQGTFLDLAGRLVARLAVGARTSPFRELSGRINYLTAFVESRESGIAPLSPVERFLVPGNPDEAVEIDVGIPAAGAATTPPTIDRPPTPATNIGGEPLAGTLNCDARQAEDPRGGPFR